VTTDAVVGFEHRDAVMRVEQVGRGEARHA
jgi:hypothetical protein